MGVKGEPKMRQMGRQTKKDGRAVKKKAPEKGQRSHPPMGEVIGGRGAMVVEKTSDLVSITTFSLTPTYVFVNPSHKSILGYDSQDLIGKCALDFIHPDDKKELLPLLAHYIDAKSRGLLLKSGEGTTEKILYRLADSRGNWRYLETTGDLLDNDHILFISKDMTQQRQIEEALRRSEEKYRNLVEDMHDVIYTVDHDGKVTLVSPSVESLMQYSPSEVIGRHFGEFIYEEDLPRLSENFQSVLSGHAAANEYRILTKRGDIRWIRTSSQPIYAGDRVIGLQGVLSDITERKEAEEKLRNSEETYRTLLENAPIGIYYNDFYGRFVYGNKKAEEIIGYKSEDLLGESFLKLELLSPDDLRKAAQLLSRNREGEATGPDELVLKKRDGSTVVVEVNTEVINVEGEQVALGMVQDITKRKQAEEALRSSEEKYRLLVENANDAIFIVQDDQIKFPNKKARDMGAHLGLELDRVPFFNYIHSNDRDKVADRLRRRLAGESIPHTYDFRLVGREGQEVWVQLNAVLIRWEGRPATLNFLRDITAQKSLESQLQQARRMEALGTLAGGIAHDFNNLLMGIQGRTSLMLMDVSPEQSHYEELKHIEDIVKSGADLTKQLLGFARGGKYELKVTNLNNLIQRTSAMFSRTRKQIRIETELAKDLWMVEVDRAQIEQVLLNLYVNAWQAMPEGGDLYIGTNNAVLDEKTVETLQVKPGKYVRVSVVDLGVGMDEATLQRIFDPFFTTQGMGRGTGLGLASAYGLLVDDEQDVLHITERLLDRIGYQVLAASNGQEAIQIYEENHENIDVVILDMIMPGMSGGDVFDRLKEINANVRVLLSSGYSIDGEASEILDRGCNGFIQKPFRINLLAQKIREVLDKA